MESYVMAKKYFIYYKYQQQLNIYILILFRMIPYQ